MPGPPRPESLGEINIPWPTSARGEAPFGWRHGPAGLVPHPEEAETLHLVLFLRAQGRSLASLPPRLAWQGLRPRRGAWTVRKLSVICRRYAVAMGLPLRGKRQ